MAPTAAAVQTVQVALAAATATLDDELAHLRARTAENFAAPRVLSPAKRRLIARHAASPIASTSRARPSAPITSTLSKTDAAYAEPAICFEQYTAAASNRIVQDQPIAHLPCVGGEGHANPLVYEVNQLRSFVKTNSAQLEQKDFALPRLFHSLERSRRQFHARDITLRYLVWRECLGTLGIAPDVVDEHFARRLDSEFDDELVARLSERTGVAKARIAALSLAVKHELRVTPSWIVNDYITARSPIERPHEPVGPRGSDVHDEFCTICRLFNCVEHEMVAGANDSTRHWRAQRQRRELEKDRSKLAEPVDLDTRARVNALGLRHPSKSSCHLALFEPELTCELIARILPRSHPAKAGSQLYPPLHRAPSPTSSVGSSRSQKGKEVAVEPITFEDPVNAEAYEPCTCKGICVQRPVGQPQCSCIERKLPCDASHCGCSSNCPRQFPPCDCASACSWDPNESRCPCTIAGRECDPFGCNCRRCDNQHAQAPNEPDAAALYCVFESKIPHSGRGLVAVRRIPSLTFLGCYAGDILSGEEAVRHAALYDARRGTTYHYDVDLTRLINADWHGSVLRFCNGTIGETGEQNITAVVKYANGTNRILFFSSRLIEAGDELLLDYGALAGPESFELIGGGQYYFALHSGSPAKA